MKVDLDYYLWRNKIQVKDFAKKINISTSQLSNIRHKKITPNLKTAMRIRQESNNEIPYDEMLATKDMAEESF